MNNSVLPTMLLSQTAWSIAGTAFITALAIGVLMTSLMHRLSWRWGALDRPDGTLKCHTKPIATLGGIPLFLAFLAGSGVLLLAGYKSTLLTALGDNIPIGALFVSGMIILSVGISDDLRQVKPRTKLLFQMLASTVLIGSGLIVHRLDFFGIFEISLGVLAVPFCLFWLVGCCNAFNFIDGLDGLASGLGVIIALCLGILGLCNGLMGPAILAFSVSGALLAILVFNIKPAIIFLGDSGSQLVGLLLGALSLKIATVNGAFALPTAGLILSVPIIDTFLSILRRYSHWDSPASGDHCHIHHRLQKYGLGVNQTIMTLWFISVLAGVVGIACRYQAGLGLGLAAVAFVMVEVYLGFRLGCLDLHEIKQRLAVSLRLAPVPVAQPAVVEHQLSHLESLWNRMKPLFEQMELDRAILTLEGVGEDGQPNIESYQWVRSEKLVADLLASRWTKRFSLGDDSSHIATLRLESVQQQLQDEQHIDWLLTQIRSNMQGTSDPKPFQPSEPLQVTVD
ncbi:MAG: undecaprenyl/decaprenyl-phosphate alpha-N-acetylglucosaminyl 1-phosphate transferase [Planctomycetes bacterium]|nr:undecaprenyl/decaprenyl-phosphate alpha-N-acetylglucosaminyl 1-phosphate transferase [Planctomycetota bacterium]